MNRMGSTALAWWEGRTLREQRMLAAMAVLILAVVVWLAIVRPLHIWRETAASDRLRAENGLLLVRSATAELEGERSGGGVDIQRAVEAAGDVHTLLLDKTGTITFGNRRCSAMVKAPGVAETLDWARALHELGCSELDLATASRTLGALVKYREDAERVRKALDVMLTR